MSGRDREAPGRVVKATPEWVVRETALPEGCTVLAIGAIQSPLDRALFADAIMRGDIDEAARILAKNAVAFTEEDAR